MLEKPANSVTGKLIYPPEYDMITNKKIFDYVSSILEIKQALPTVKFDITDPAYNSEVDIKEKGPLIAPFHLLLIGDVGCGKTSLCELIADHLFQLNRLPGKGVSKMQFVDPREIWNSRNKALLCKDSQALTETEMAFRGTSICIDDLGTEGGTRETSGMFFEGLLLDYDKSIRKGLCDYSIITTNLTQEQLIPRYGSRAISRIVDNHCILVFADKCYRAGNPKIIKAGNS